MSLHTLRRGHLLLAIAICLGFLASIADAARAPGVAISAVASERSTGPDRRLAMLHPSDGPDADVRITVGPKGVSIAIVVNLIFADEVVGVLRENLDELVEVEHAPLRDALRAFFRKGTIVHVDGVQVDPSDGDFAVEDPDDSIPLEHFPQFGKRSTTKLRLDLRYSSKTPPKSLKVLWSAFPPDLAVSDREDAPPIEVAALVLADGREEQVTFRVEEPEYRWVRDPAARAALFAMVPPAAVPAQWQLPVASLVCALLAVLALIVAFVVPARQKVAGIAFCAGLVLATVLWPVARYQVTSPFASEPLPDTKQCRAIFEALHANVYRAFDFGTEDEIYDALARSVHGRLLEDLYDSVYEGLVLREEGGAVSRVKRVQLAQAEVAEPRIVEDAASFEVDARWSVYGEVYHWGHGHNQTNEYLAQYRIARVADSWRIVAHTPKASKVLQKRPSLGK